MTLVSVVIPTVPGREDHYQRCLDAVRSRSVNDIEVITEMDHATVGLAWQAGAVRATGAYIALLSDDLEPAEGWDAAAVALCATGVIPAPRVVDARNGQLQSRPVPGPEFPDGTDCGISVVPFMSREQWEVIQPLFTGHYYTDDFISYRARQAGWPSLMCNGYSFRHHWAQVRRGAGMTEDQRMIHDYHLYAQAVRLVATGQWTKPWPGAPSTL